MWQYLIEKHAKAIKGVENAESAVMAALRAHKFTLTEEQLVNPQHSITELFVSYVADMRVTLETQAAVDFPQWRQSVIMLQQISHKGIAKYLLEHLIHKYPTKEQMDVFLGNTLDVVDQVKKYLERLDVRRRETPTYLKT